MGLKTGAKKQLIVHERNIKSNDNSKFDFITLINYNKLSNNRRLINDHRNEKSSFIGFRI